jgi:hypothetical protein
MIEVGRVGIQNPAPALYTATAKKKTGGSPHRTPGKDLASHCARTHIVRLEQHFKMRQGPVREPYPIQEWQQFCVVVNEVHCRLSAGHRNTLDNDREPMGFRES